MQSRGATWVDHYRDIDDFFTMEVEGTTECVENVSTMKGVFCTFLWRLIDLAVHLSEAPDLSSWGRRLVWTLNGGDGTSIARRGRDLDDVHSEQRI